jgi:hypothetical protein
LGKVGGGKGCHRQRFAAAQQNLPHATEMASPQMSNIFLMQQIFCIAGKKSQHYKCEITCTITKFKVSTYLHNQLPRTKQHTLVITASYLIPNNTH